jgi:hypothetical protein
MNRARAGAKVAPPEGAVRTTEEVAGSLKAGSGGRAANHSVRVAGALELPEAALPIPPYTLGAWLGDGKTATGSITSHPDDFLLRERIQADGFVVRSQPCDKQEWGVLGLKVLLRSAGVLGNKHIPAAYLRASFAKRLELLRGLMDTDGNCDKDGGATFNNTLEHLAIQVLELARSLGIKATFQVGRSRLNGVDFGPAYRVKMTTTVKVFHLPRKAERQKDAVRPTQGWHFVTGCERVPTVPVRCIAVDSPSRLYLAGRSFVPTHNTDLALGLSVIAHYRTLILRREAVQLTAVVDRLKQIVGRAGQWRGLGYGGTMRVGERVIELGGCEHEDDKDKYQGRPHSLKVFDEATHFTKSQYRFISGWNRTERPGERCRVLLTGNPPTTPEGRWVVEEWAPWLDQQHPDPARPGELRWYTYIDGS